ncbi:MAG: serine/threonine protein kinase, partial [Bryobacterales bacterium]|nr:serine/threonine protein kinase [Bryobacterales bacterium]
MENEQRDALPLGSTVKGYTTEAVLGQGGYGIVYRARCSKYRSQVAIKEYLPTELAVRIGGIVQPRNPALKNPYKDGLRRFSDESERLKEFSDCPNIVSCSDFFWANGTAYMVMEWEDGLPLSKVLSMREAQGNLLGQQDLLAVTIPLLQALRRIHSAGVLHRDIKPSNVLLRRKDDQPVLIDFGAAKQAVADRTKSLAPYTEGYAAIEQVGEGELGTWTDIYGVGALMWRIVAGSNPPWNPPNPPRVENRASAVVRGTPDPLVPAVQLGAKRFSRQILEGIDKALALKESDRIQNSDELIGHLLPLEDDSSQTKDIQYRRRVVGWVIAACSTVFATLLLFFSPMHSPSTSTNPSTARFTVATEPARANVELLGTRDTYRPGIHLSPGLYRVKVSAPGYESTIIEVRHGDSTSHNRVALNPSNPPQVAVAATAPFTVNPNPAGAKVVLLATDKTYRSGMELFLGTHLVEVSAEGYRTRRVSIDHRGSKPHFIRLDRITQPFTVDTDPRSAQVKLLDGSVAYTPGVLLPPGMYRVKVSAPGYEDKVTQIEHLQAVAHTRVALERLREPRKAPLIEHTANLTISTEPTNAKVVILNNDKSYVDGIDIALGAYEVEVSAQGYITRRILIHHRGRDTHNVELERQPAAFTVSTDPANA